MTSNASTFHLGQNGELGEGEKKHGLFYISRKLTTAERLIVVRASPPMPPSPRRFEMLDGTTSQHLLHTAEVEEAGSGKRGATRLLVKSIVQHFIVVVISLQMSVYAARYSRIF